jgi:glutamate--cysteine ligase
MPKLEYSDLLKWFNQGEKPSKNWRIGTEHEKFVFYTNNFKRVSYLGASGISELLNALAIKNNWVKIIENNNTIGLKDDTGASTSL